MNRTDVARCKSPSCWHRYLLLLWTVAPMLLSQPALAEDRTLPTQAGAIKVETIAKGLHNPWGLAFLPDGQMLVTERSGTLRFVSKDGTISKPLSGVPEVFAEGQDGLLDVAIDPEFKSNHPASRQELRPADSKLGFPL
jgi:aldose sugar dehydrogenase